MKQKIAEQILCVAKQRIVDLQSYFANRLQRNEYDYLVSQLQDLEVMNLAAQIAMNSIDETELTLSIETFLSQLLELSTQEEQQTITILNDPVPSRMTGKLNVVISFIQVITSILSRNFDPYSLVRALTFHKGTLIVNCLGLNEEHLISISEELLDFFKTSEPDTLFSKDYRCLDYFKCQFYKLIKLKQSLSINVDLKREEDWFNIQFEIPVMFPSDFIQPLNHGRFIYLDGENISKYSQLIMDISNFEIKWITDIDDMIYSEDIDFSGRIALNFYLESNDSLVELIDIYEKYPSIFMDRELLFSYIGSNYLQTPLPDKIKLYQDRIISNVPIHFLESIFIPKSLMLVSEHFQRKYRILSLEDHVAAKKVLDHLLGDKVQLVHFSDGLSALDYLIKDSDFDLFLIDIGLPTISGIDFVKQLPKQAQLIPKVAVTVHYFTHMELRQLGFDDLLSKPYTSQRLMYIIQHYCGKY